MKLLRLFADDQEVATIRPSVPLALAMLCAEPSCKAIYEAGGPNTCPRCGCAEAWPMARGVDRPATGAAPSAAGATTNDDTKEAVHAAR